MTTTGTGTSVEEAVDNALRSAIEQAYGAFISSDTRILNDELIQDEIVSISSGNILSYQILSTDALEHGTVHVVVSSVVSVTSLSTYVENTGGSTKFKGGLFGFHIKQQALNESNERIVVDALIERLERIAGSSFDYSVEVGNPVLKRTDLWTIPLSIVATENDNFDSYRDLLFNTLDGISLSLDEINQYQKVGKSVFPITLSIREDTHKQFILRSGDSFEKIINHVYDLAKIISNVRVANDLEEWRIMDRANRARIKSVGDSTFVKVLKGLGLSIYTSDHKSVESVSVFNYSTMARSNRLTIRSNAFSPVSSLHDIKLRVTEQGKKIKRRNRSSLRQDRFDIPVHFGFLNEIPILMREMDQYTMKVSGPGSFHVGLAISFAPQKDNHALGVRLRYDDMRPENEVGLITEYRVR